MPKSFYFYALQPKSSKTSDPCFRDSILSCPPSNRSYKPNLDNSVRINISDDFNILYFTSSLSNMKQLVVYSFSFPVLINYIAINDVTVTTHCKTKNSTYSNLVYFFFIKVHFVCRRLGVEPSVTDCFLRT